MGMGVSMRASGIKTSVMAKVLSVTRLVIATLANLSTGKPMVRAFTLGSMAKSTMESGALGSSKVTESGEG